LVQDKPNGVRISSKATTLSLCSIKYSQRQPVAHDPEEDAEFTTKNHSSRFVIISLRKQSSAHNGNHN
ncbi:MULTISPECIES: hypothetical protein, partial [unclassified Pseudoalteromonas]|uniref:hypothetical protein n=1 Tax=unclassified Pseudoalteromonas TaxID=194690 RepID=UPI001C71831B